MSLTHKYTPFPNSSPSNLFPYSKPFEQTLINRLSSLRRRLSPPDVPLSTLALAVGLLSTTLSDFALLLSDRNLSRSDADIAALSSHLDSSAVLLSAANSLTAAVDYLSRLRIHLAFALHLLSQTPELTPKARAFIAEWTDNLRTPAKFPSITDLIRTARPRGNISTVHRAIYAVEAVSALVVGLASSFLGSKPDLAKLRVSGEFPWSTAFNGVLTEVISRSVGSSTVEIKAVNAGVKELTAGNGDVEGLKKLTEELTVELEGLGNAVNRLFRAGLCARDAALLSFRIGPNKCK